MEGRAEVPHVAKELIENGEVCESHALVDTLGREMEAIAEIPQCSQREKLESIGQIDQCSREPANEKQWRELVRFTS